ncbi:MAG: DUF5060 domain-containing protein [Luteitalea sp.]|nr:DUF5060 domain-containing protein [Luteitalea sp.]
MRRLGSTWTYTPDTSVRKPWTGIRDARFSSDRKLGGRGVSRLVAGVMLFAVAAVAVPTASPTVALLSPEVERWGIQEVSLESARKYANPFADVQVKGRFRSGDTELVVDGFYDGNRTWKVRVMPTVEGPWTFEITSNDPELDGQRGAFECRSPQPGNHGPVTVRNTYHLSYADSTPYFPLGTTLYNWVHRSSELQERTLATLKAAPFNKVRMCVFPKWYPFNRVEPPRYPFAQAGDGTFDLDRFNPDYFGHIEERVADLQALGIEADVIIFHPYDRWGFSSMGRAQDDAYLRYLIARLGAYRNVWWELASEHDLITPPKDWDHVFEMVDKLDPYDHLRSIHNWRSWYDYSKPLVTHLKLQQQSDDHHAAVVNARYKYRKPVVIDELGYEGNNGHGWGMLTGPEAVARQWRVAIGGGYASHGETYVHRGEVLWWSHGGELVGESPERLAFLKKIMMEAPFQEMEPVLMDIWTPGALGLAKPGEHYLFYFDGGQRPRRIELDLPGPGSYRVDLIDPWLMEVHPLGAVDAGSQFFTAAFVPSLLRIVKLGEDARSGPRGTLEKLMEDWSSGQ